MGGPVITHRAGGALGTVVAPGEGRDPPTGIFFTRQDVSYLVEAIRAVRHADFDPEALGRHALRFDRSRFVARIRALLEEEERLIGRV